MTGRSPIRNHLRWVQAVLILVLMAFVARHVVREWDHFSRLEFEFAFSPGWLALALAITWVMYGVLIDGWRCVVVGWGERLPWLTAARIWILASFGKYLPGRVWAIAGAAMMSQRAGVRPAVATGGAILMQVFAIGTGVVVTAAAIGRQLEMVRPGAGKAMAIVGCLALAGLAVLGNGWLGERVWRIMRWQDPPPGALPPGTALRALTWNLVAWVGYGAALWALARGILPDPPLTLRTGIGAFSAAYLAGFLSPFAPGGLGVRDVLLFALLTPELPAADALALVGASRLTLTLNELGAAAPFIFLRKREAP